MKPLISSQYIEEDKSKTTSYPEDSILVQKTLDGDNDALVRFLQTDCFFIFYNIQKGRLQHLDLTPSDLINDFYIYLNKEDWKILRSFRFESKLKTWMSTVALRYLYQKYRKELKESAQLNPLVCETTMQETMFIEKKLTRFELEDAISKLSNERDRDVLLYTLKDYKPEEIALKMKVSISNVYVLRNRAIRNLKKLFNEGR
jgi:RNA polymerase sigma factor (sigma-70 family)